MHHKMSDGSGIVFGPPDSLTRSISDTSLWRSFASNPCSEIEIKDGNVKPVTESWFREVGDSFQSEEEFKEIAPTIYAIAKELEAIQKMKQTEELLNVKGG